MASFDGCPEVFHALQLLSIDFNIEALAFVPGPDGTRGRRIHVLGREVRDRPGLVEYLSPAFGSRVALDGYCKANFDAVLHLAYPDHQQWGHA